MKRKILLLVALAAQCQAQEHHRIVISIPDRTLTLFEGDHATKTYDIAVGKPLTPSPEGKFEVVTRLNHPTWYTHGKVVGPGKANPLGTRWLGLSKKGYGIHGTNEPESIGKAVSHGCIRMRNEDVEELFELVETGVQVELTGTKESTTNAVY
jgi:lipoprotein-anchoring transpeptidase ErfK/SrfK